MKHNMGSFGLKDVWEYSKHLQVEKDPVAEPEHAVGREYLESISQ